MMLTWLHVTCDTVCRFSYAGNVVPDNRCVRQICVVSVCVQMSATLSPFLIHRMLCT